MEVNRVLMNRAGVNRLQMDECTESCEQGFAEEESEQSGSEEGECEKIDPPA